MVFEIVFSVATAFQWQLAGQHGESHIRLPD
jgi:hypothetical protein